MSNYLVKTKMGTTQWQIKTEIRKHQLISDNIQQDAGPNPVEYLCTSIDSCIAMSAWMIIKKRALNISNFRLENNTKTKKLEHGKSIVSQMQIKIYFDSNLTPAEKDDFLDFILHVSTIYQTLKLAIPITVQLG